MYFPKYRLPKIWLEKCLKSRVWEDSLINDMANGWKLTCNLNGSTFEIFINHFVCFINQSVLVRHKFIRLFVNTLTVYDKHYLLNRDNLAQPIQMQLSKKQKRFSQFFFAFLKSTLNFRHLPNKDDPHSWCYSRNTGSEKHG